MSDILEKLELILKKIEVIEIKLGIVEENCNNMGNHIDFINTVYNTMRTPLDFIIKRVSIINGNKHIERLPISNSINL